MAPGRRSKCSLINLAMLLIADLARAERLHVDAQRVRHANGVRHLDLAAVRQPGSHHVLGHPAAGVRRGPVHLRGVLAAKSAAAVPAHAAVRIHDDLASGHSRVAHRSADDELAGRVHVNFGGCAAEQIALGRTGLMMCSITLSVISAWLMPSACCVLMSTVSTRTGLP